MLEFCVKFKSFFNGIALVVSQKTGKLSECSFVYKTIVNFMHNALTTNILIWRVLQLSIKTGKDGCKHMKDQNYQEICMINGTAIV